MTAEDRGAILVWVAISLPVLVGMAAFTVDAGAFFVTRAELQNAADAASLEAIIEVDLSDVDEAGERAAAEAEGTAIADRNHSFSGGDPDMTYQWGRIHTDGEFYPDENGDGFVFADVDGDSVDDLLGPTNAVRALASRPGFPTIFGSILGVDDVDISASAVASKREVVVDFEGLAEGAGPLDSDPAVAGEVPSNFLEITTGNGMRGEIGGSVRVWSNAGFGPMVFDSTCAGGASGGDPDLCVDDQGNVLIVSEDGDASDPDDDSGGFQMFIDFSGLEGGSVDIQNLIGVDIDANEVMTLTAYNASGGVIDTQFICGPSAACPGGDSDTVSFGGDGTTAPIFPDLVEDVVVLEISHGGSGGIDDVGFGQVIQLRI